MLAMPRHKSSLAESGREALLGRSNFLRKCLFRIVKIDKIL